jgi:hypothetical protein
MGNREPGRDKSSASFGSARRTMGTLPRARTGSLIRPGLTHTSATSLSRAQSYGISFNPTNCEPQDVHSRKTSQAVRILSHPKQRLGWGWVGGFLDANSLRHSEQPGKRTNKSLANGCSAVPAKQATGLGNDRPPRSGLGRDGVLGLRRWGREGGLLSPQRPPKPARLCFSPQQPSCCGFQLRSHGTPVRRFTQSRLQLSTTEAIRTQPIATPTTPAKEHR